MLSQDQNKDHMARPLIRRTGQWTILIPTLFCHQSPVEDEVCRGDDGDLAIKTKDSNMCRLETSLKRKGEAWGATNRAKDQANHT
jgi:hypothetical protein